MLKIQQCSFCTQTQGRVSQVWTESCTPMWQQHQSELLRQGGSHPKCPPLNTQTKSMPCDVDNATKSYEAFKKKEDLSSVTKQMSPETIPLNEVNHSDKDKDCMRLPCEL